MQPQTTAQGEPPEENAPFGYRPVQRTLPNGSTTIEYVPESRTTTGSNDRDGPVTVPPATVPPSGPRTRTWTESKVLSEASSTMVSTPS